ncbi:hypothetical protein [Roseateles sp. BYS78W]
MSCRCAPAALVANCGFRNESWLAHDVRQPEFQAHRETEMHTIERRYELTPQGWVGLIGGKISAGIWQGRYVGAGGSKRTVRKALRRAKRMHAR